MDAKTALPLAVRTFLNERVRSIEGVEALLLLHRERARSFSETELAEMLRLDVTLLHERLDELVGAGLLGIDSSSLPARYRYQTADEQLEPVVVQLADIYASRRVDVLIFIATGAMDRVRSSALHAFSEAFRLRGPKKNG